jgi:hypothetical protein
MIGIMFGLNKPAEWFEVLSFRNNTGLDETEVHGTLALCSLA